MRTTWKRSLAVGIAIGTLLGSAAPSAASTFNVVVDSSFLSGAPATLAFDFLDGGPPTNTVNLSVPTLSNGAVGSASVTGDVTGTGPWLFSDSSNTSFFNELLIDYTQLGTSLTFSFTTTDLPPDPGFSPDSFAFFVLNTSDLSQALITTNDPTGSNALFLLSFGQGADGLTVFTPDQSDFGIGVTAEPNAIPEPGTIALLAAGFGALLRRRRLASA